MRQTMRLGILGLLALAGAGPAWGQGIVRVPQDAATLLQAVQQVPAGGVIELAAGTYASPTDGFRIRFVGKGFTIRAASGTEVILDGGGSRPILRLEDSAAGAGRVITFERLIFRNGRSTTESVAGAVTVASGEVVFRGCSFRNNTSLAPTTGAGAVLLTGGTIARFFDSEWRNNTTNTRGGAIAMLFSTAEVRRSRFIDNRTDIAGHANNAAGGAIFAFDSQLRVETSHFTGNRAGFAGGALYGFGLWANPVSVPRTEITVVGSTFTANRAAPATCCVAIPSAGGAIHVEDQATLKVFTSQFVDNVSEWGGALSSNHSLADVEDSIFRRNRATGNSELVAAGGTFIISSSDVDPIDRRVDRVTMKRSLVQGIPGQAAGTNGGCIFAGGDIPSQFGAPGLPPRGTPATNRAVLVLEDMVFADCNVERSVLAQGFGGAVLIDLADLTLTDSLIIDSHARENGSVGGGLVSLGPSKVTVTGTTFARNSADTAGGAALLNGAEIAIRDSLFLANELSPGTAEPIGNSRGAALLISPDQSNDPARRRNVTGVVEGSLFVANVGLPVFDVDVTNGPINDVRYNDNRFHSTTFGNRVFLNTVAGFGGQTVAELNSLVVQRANGTSTPKSQVDNTFLASAPDVGKLVAVPALLLEGAEGSQPTAFLGYAWNGSSAMLANTGLAERTGLFEVHAPGTYRLRVDGTILATAMVAGAASGGCLGTPGLCLNSDRFEVTVTWRDFQGNTGTGKVVPLGSDDSGLFWFFSAANWEMLVKVLNGCPINSRFWVFSAATTTVEYTLRVHDTATGAVKTYFNPLGNAAAAITDTEAFATCGSGVVAPPSPAAVRLPEAEALLEPVKGGGCSVDATHLCLNDGRFRVEVTWRDFDGDMGPGRRVQGGSDDSGLFWFFSENNWEMLVKVLNGCSINNRVWVFSAATTTVGYTLRITDTMTGAVKQYTNPVGNAAAALADTEAFASCQ